MPAIASTSFAGHARSHTAAQRLAAACASTRGSYPPLSGGSAGSCPFGVLPFVSEQSRRERSLCSPKPGKETSVRSFILLYHGPATPPEASHEGWPQWFQGVGDKLVDLGSPMADGFVIRADGTIANCASPLNGYSIIRAEDRDAVLAIVHDHPFLAAGAEYTIEVFEVPRK